MVVVCIKILPLYTLNTKKTSKAFLQTMFTPGLSLLHQPLKRFSGWSLLIEEERIVGKEVKGVVLAACSSLINQKLCIPALQGEGHRGVCWPAGSETCKQKRVLCLCFAACVRCCAYVFVFISKHVYVCAYDIHT